ncbi:MAG: magnesium transporter CorA family protein [Alphaproteobacteria bacterium]|nr:magnesium transporter CorA family protein [Alphaproteobacteria bacterium]
MLIVHRLTQGRLIGETLAPEAALPAEALWVDLDRPDPAEVAAIEARFGLSLPSEAEMGEIEVSNRLYDEDGVLFMTAMILSEADTPRPLSRAVTFILTPDCLVTLRHSEPRPFAAYARRLAADTTPPRSPEHILCGLWQAIIGRSADVVERLQGEIETLGDTIFARAGEARPVRPAEFRRMLAALGRANELTARLQDSQFSLARVIGFPEQTAPERWSSDYRLMAHGLRRDVTALTEHTEFLAGKIAFLLDATLGMISVEQNAIIRILSVVATVLLPPTLIASVYGMNFTHMPELGWPLGYPLALALMVISALGPYLFFKARGWL